MGYVQVSSLGDYISRQTGARVATSAPGGFPQNGFPQDGNGDDGGDGGWQPWMAPDSPWSRGQATADKRRRRHTPLPQRGGHGSGHHVAGGHHGGGRMHGLGFTHPGILNLFRGVRPRAFDPRVFDGSQRAQAHPFRLWGRHPMAPVCTDPSCPQCTDPNFPGYNPDDPICQAGLSGCLGALAPVIPIIRGTPVPVIPRAIVGRRMPIVGHPNVNRPIIARSTVRYTPRLPGWGARRNTGQWGWNNRRGWAPGTSNWAPWNVSPVCSDETSQYYNPNDPSCATGAADVNEDSAAAATTPAAATTAAAAPAAKSATSSSSWIWLAGGAVLLIMLMKK